MSFRIRQYKGTDKWEVDIRFKLPSGKVVQERRKSSFSSRSLTQRWAEQREHVLFEKHNAPTHVQLAVDLLAKVKPIKPWPTCSGVYAVLGAEHYVKIGKAANIRDRLSNLQTANPVPLELLAVLSNDPESEASFHARWIRWRRDGEWFELSTDMCEAIVRGRRA